MTTAIMEHPETFSSPIADTLAPYEQIESWPAGSVIFREGSPASGVYFLHSGRVDLSFSSKPLLGVDAGQILGITSVMSNRAHDSSATTRTRCVTGFVEKSIFLRLLDEKPTLWLAVLQMISADINACWECMRSLSGR